MIVAKHNTSEKTTAPAYCDQPPELVVLCTEHCPYEDCTRRDGCKEYKEIRAAIRAGKPFEYPQAWQPSEPAEEITDPQTLFDMAWAKMDKEPIEPYQLTDEHVRWRSSEPSIMIEPKEPPAPDVQAEQKNTLRQLNRAISALDIVQHGLWGETIIQDMLRDLHGMRCKHFGHLVDWDAVAGGTHED